MDRSQALSRREDLISKGWIRRFTAEEPRVSEAKELYESLGLEVLIEPACPEDDRECTCCFDVEDAQERYKTIYTRGEGRANQESEELFE